MKEWIAAIILGSVVTTTGMAANGPEVNLVDNKLSVNAESIPLGRLLRLVDLATGMKSTVPPELATRNISVKFSGLPLSDAVRKIFQGQPLDYLVVEGQSIKVTAQSQATAVAGGGDSTPYNPPANSQPIEQPFVQEFPPAPIPVPQVQQAQPQQPAMVQTPFGPIPNPRAQQQPSPNGLNPGSALFPQAGQQPLGQPQTNPGFPGTTQIGSPNPFASPSPFGSPQNNLPGQNPPNQNNNNLFGNSAPVFGTPGTQR